MVAKTSTTFEEALNMTGFGKFNFLAMLVNISLITGMAFEIMSVAYLVPASACELNTTVFQQGLMAGMPLLGIIATSHFWGYLADTKGRRKILALCMILAFLAGCASALSPDWIVFSVLKFLSSAAVSGTYALAVTLLSECTPQNRRSILVASTSTIYLAASGVMAVLSIPVLQLSFSYDIPLLGIAFTPWRLLNIIFAMPCAIGAIGVYISYESPRYLLSIGEDYKAMEVLKGFFVINSGKSADEYKVGTLVLGEDTGKAAKGFWASIVSQTVPLMKPPLLKNTVLLSILFIIVYVGLNPFIVWLPFITDGVMKSLENGKEDLKFCEMLNSVKNTTVTEINDCSLNKFAMITVFVISIMIAALNVVLSCVINCVGRKNMFICIQVVSGVAGISVGVSDSWVASAVCLVVFVAGMLNFGMLSAISVDIFPTYVKAMAVCVTLMVGRGSSFLGINVVKNMLVNDCEMAFYSFGGLTFVGGLIAFLLPNENTLQKKIPVDS
ncbi:putative transporter svop-1 isoform X2 [Maniola jurtina]|uniref:putative transporter svop-1 isoform X2 n=1 Tax=Maniola jurtina TaxID=191418 RepID=UPI001E687CE8|nr:putative transporter svop-1 isoform X2 [Maniola jurtina]